MSNNANKQRRRSKSESPRRKRLRNIRLLKWVVYLGVLAYRFYRLWRKIANLIDS